MSEAVTAPRPQWMDDDLLKTCVRNSKDLPKETDLQINNVDISYAVPKGENYLSLVYRVKIDWHINKGKSTIWENGLGNNSLSIVAKAGLEMEDIKKMTKENHVFDKEIDMYMNLIPKLNQVLKDSGLQPINSCKFLYAQMNDPELIVMEDLKADGYVTADKLKGLNLEESKLVLDQMAKIHSSSMQFFTQNELQPIHQISPLVPKRDDPYDNDNRKGFRDSMRTNVAEIVEDLNPDPKYKNAIMFLKWYAEFENEFEGSREMVSGNKFNGLNHGDVKTSNIMFKYGPNKDVQSVVILDLQIGYFSSVINDFIFYFFTSVNVDTMRSHFKTMKTFYMDSLIFHLTKLGYAGEIPTMEDFDAEFNRLRRPVADVIVSINTIVFAEINAKQLDRNEGEVFSFEDMMKMTLNTKAKAFRRVLMASIDVLDEVDGFFNGDF